MEAQGQKTYQVVGDPESQGTRRRVRWRSGVRGLRKCRRRWRWWRRRRDSGRRRRTRRDAGRRGRGMRRARRSKTPTVTSQRPSSVQSELSVRPRGPRVPARPGRHAGVGPGHPGGARDVEPGDTVETHLDTEFRVRKLRGPDLFNHLERTGAPMMPPRHRPRRRSDRPPGGRPRPERGDWDRCPLPRISGASVRA